MQVTFTVDGVTRQQELEPGTLLSEVLMTEQAVWLEGRLVDPRLMLAAQAQGRVVELRPAVVSPPLQENLLIPEPSRC